MTALNKAQRGRFAELRSRKALEAGRAVFADLTPLERVLRSLDPMTGSYQPQFEDPGKFAQRILVEEDHRKRFDHGDWDALPRFVGLYGPDALKREWVIDAIKSLSRINNGKYRPVRTTDGKLFFTPEEAEELRQRARDALVSIGNTLARTGAGGNAEPEKVARAAREFDQILPVAQALRKLVRRDPDWRPTEDQADLLAAQHGIPVDKIHRLIDYLPDNTPYDACLRLVAAENLIGRRVIEKYRSCNSRKRSKP